MELTLNRTYHPRGVNGELLCGHEIVCHTIELPWRENARNVSCIPEGRYKIQPRFTEDRGWHIELTNVPERSGILIHTANDAMKELKGCIAPVTRLTGPGEGLQSRVANIKLKHLVYDAVERDEPVFLTIRTNAKHYEHY